MDKEKCLQQIIGACNGCAIYEMAEAKSNGDRDNINATSKRIEKVYCPEGTVMQPIRPPNPSSIM